MTNPEWGVATVGDLLTLKYGKALAPDLRNPLGAFPVVGSGGRMTATDKPLVSEPVVLIGRKGNIGAVRLEPNGCWPIDTTYYASIPDRLDSRFLRYQLIGLDMRKLDSSTTTPSLRRQDLESQELAIPPLSKQLQIVAILEDHFSRLDAADASVSRSIRRLASLRDASLYQALESAHQSPGVKSVSLGDMAKVSSGLTPLKGNKSFYLGGTVPWITSGDLHQGMITTAKHFVTQKAIEETSLKVVPAGTLLVAMYGEGKTRGTAAELQIDAATNQACAAVQLHDRALRSWVRLVLDANYSKLRRLAAGGVQPNLNLSIVRAIEIPVPDSSVRNELLRLRDEAEEANGRLRRELAAAAIRSTRLRRSLLTAAFSGGLTANLSDSLEAVETTPV